MEQPMISDQLRAEIRQIVREELVERNKRLVESFERCAPTGKEFFQGLHESVGDSEPAQH